MKLSSMLIICCCYFLLLQIATTFVSIDRIFQNWSQQHHIVLMLDTELSPAEVQTVTKTLKSYPQVQSLKVLSGDELAHEIVDTLAKVDDRGYTQSEIREFLGPAITLNLRTSADIPLVVEKVKKLWQVADVATGSRIGEQFGVWRTFAYLIGYGIILVLLFACALIIENIIRTDVYARREEIEILELVGASPARIRLPFLKEALVINFISILGALIGVSVLTTLVSEYLAQQENWFHLAKEFALIPVGQILGLVAVAMVLSAGIAYRSVRSINSGWAASQRS
jgi:cell division transport system permease protein